MDCKAIRVNDEMHCGACGLQWPHDDPDPPTCPAERPASGFSLGPDCDERPSLGGWAPGRYLNRCACGSEFVGDKRAVCCAPCAYSDPLAEARRLLDDE